MTMIFDNLTSHRAVSPSVRLSSAQDDFAEEVRALFEVPSGAIDRDLIELEALAQLTANFARNARVLLDRMTFATDSVSPSYDLGEMIVDAFDGEIRLGLDVVRAGVRAKS